MIEIQGHDAGTGKLNNLFRLLARYNPAAATYVEKLDHAASSGNRMALNFLSPLQTQRLLSVMKRLVVKQIANRIRKHGKCAIIADDTYDSSKREATVLLLRYVEVDEQGSPRPVERLADVFTGGDSSGKELCAEIEQSLKAMDVDIQSVVGIIDMSIVERTKLKRRMAGENSTDESRSGEERLRVAMFVPVLDQLIVQLQERFSDEQIGLMKEMSLFSSGALKSGSTISPTDITHLTQTYHLDSDAIAAEYSDFCTAFGSLNLIELCESYHIQIINDQLADTAVNVVDEETVEADAEQPTADVDHRGSRVEETETKGDEDDDYHDEVTDVDKKKK